jgi:hypothetical protein
VEGPVGNVDEKGTVPVGLTGPVGKTPVLGKERDPVAGAEVETRVELGKPLKLDAPEELPVPGADGKGAVPELTGEVAGRENPELAGSVPVVPLSRGPMVEPPVGSEEGAAIGLSVGLTDAGPDVLPFSGVELGTPVVGDVTGAP